jgi:hypothetical protein
MSEYRDIEYRFGIIRAYRPFIRKDHYEIPYLD